MWREGDGYLLSWKFAQIVTGNGIGMITPSRIQPGALAAQLSLTAPVSLFFYFFILFVLSVLRGIDIHPLNYLLIAGAFFASTCCSRTRRITCRSNGRSRSRA